ncbi:MAG: AraC family transcriptional regulator [Pigmentiphaga sp.]|uniref:AraC family transcriptional regulator n=1 Tax=Pigmentiphaga sp. TaxID=1977564 RepID=UPI0029AB1211|nr:AraC family transcriptional regulator [Pigmentiphaga sp.]MDX3904539.1 AraC family transcriptional regulator [Pigmentiphaga sp.]
MPARPRDLLSRLLAHWRSERAVTARFSLSTPWSLHSSGVEGALIRICSGAPYWLALDGTQPVQIEAGDIVMLPHGDAHTVASAPGLAPRPFQPLIATHQVGAHGDQPIVFSFGGDGPVTELFSLHLWMPEAGLAPLVDALPRLIVVRRRDVPMTSVLALTVESLVNQTLEQPPGWQLATARMSDLLLVHIVAEHLRPLAERQASTLRGMQDPNIARALLQIHEHPERPWSVATLAAAGYLSRTVFSERFRRLVGMTPMQYLASHRMAVAAERLKDPAADLDRVAQAVGYESTKAFSRAFRRWNGKTPAEYCRRG